VFRVPGADGDANAGDRTYLVLARPDVIMNDTRPRGLVVAGSDADGRKNPPTTPGPLGTLDAPSGMRPAGARPIQPEGLDSKSADDLGDALADALEELHRL
jgi:hypothetical protein